MCHTHSPVHSTPCWDMNSILCPAVHSRPAGMLTPYYCFMPVHSTSCRAACRPLLRKHMPYPLHTVPCCCSLRPFTPRPAGTPNSILFPVCSLHTLLAAGLTSLCLHKKSRAIFTPYCALLFIHSTSTPGWNIKNPYCALLFIHSMPCWAPTRGLLPCHWNTWQSETAFMI